MNDNEPLGEIPEADPDIFLAEEKRRILIEQGHSLRTYFFEVLVEGDDSIRIAIAHVSSEMAAELAELIHKDALILPASGPAEQ